ncbi:MAG: hypothetical protein NTZ98_21580, partial [Acidobacteria bacterium]|nr:hypothetical protein [Acidobacteriota bacterium]
IDDVEDHVFRKSGRINSTWGGNLVDMVRGAKYAQVIAEDKLVDNARDMGCPIVGTDGVGIMTAGPWKDYVVGGASAVYWPGPLPHLDFPCGLAGVWVAEV